MHRDNLPDEPTLAGLPVVPFEDLETSHPASEHSMFVAVGYPLVPIAYMIGAATILVILLLYKTQTTWPGLLLVLTGVPVYLIWRRGAASTFQHDALLSA